MQKLDETDRKILLTLQTNARISYADLGRQVNLTAPAVAGRIRRLEELGIITGYHAQINLKGLDNGLMLFIRMVVPHHREKQFTHFMHSRPEIVEGYIISGEESFLLKVVTTSTRHLNELLTYLIGYGQPTTSLIITQLALPPTPVGEREWFSMGESQLGGQRGMIGELPTYSENR